MSEMSYDEWVADEAIEKLTLRRALSDVEDPVAMATQLFKESLPIAVMSMTHLAIHGSSEAIRYQGSKFVIERCMGVTPRMERPGDERPAWEKIWDSAITETDKAEATAVAEEA